MKNFQLSTFNIQLFFYLCTMKLSIIVPVYRVANTLRRCVDSIVSQSFSDWELILVDDGSPDECGAICDEYAGKDSRIRVIHKANGGLSDARNAGLKVAEGEFVTFVDSDDYIRQDTYEHVMEMANEEDEVEIIEYPILVHAGHASEQELRFDNIIYPDSRTYWLEGQAYAHSYACNKVFRRYLLLGTDFPKGYKFEDVWTLPQILKHEPVVMTIAEGMYYYCWNNEGITVKASGDDLRQLLDAQIEAAKTLNISWQSKDAAAYYLHVLNTQLDVCKRCKTVPVLPARHLSSDVARTTHERIKIFILNTLGLNVLCKLKQWL